MPCTSSHNVNHHLRMNSRTNSKSSHQQVTPANTNRSRKMKRQLIPLSASQSPENDPTDKESSNIESLIQNLLDSDPEAINRVNRVTDAAKKVAELQMEQARLARALADAQDSSDAASADRERRANEAASKILADAEVEAAKLRLRAAELEAQAADSQKDSIALQANMDAERLETAKAGVASVAGSILVTLPLALASSSPAIALESVGDSAVCAFLFGLVYRYAVRDDVRSNTQLKAGIVAAFGLVRGITAASAVLGGADAVLDGVSLDALGRAALSMGESMLVFGFASVVLEFALLNNWIKRFNGSSSS